MASKVTDARGIPWWIAPNWGQSVLIGLFSCEEDLGRISSLSFNIRPHKMTAFGADSISELFLVCSTVNEVTRMGSES